MASDLADVELYHQEKLRNIELRSGVKIDRRSARSALKDTSPPNDEDKEFVNSYVKDSRYHTNDYN